MILVYLRAISRYRTVGIMRRLRLCEHMVAGTVCGHDSENNVLVNMRPYLIGAE